MGRQQHGRHTSSGNLARTTLSSRRSISDQWQQLDATSFALSSSIATNSLPHQNTLGRQQFVEEKENLPFAFAKEIDENINTLNILK